MNPSRGATYAWQDRLRDLELRLTQAESERDTLRRGCQALEDECAAQAQALQQAPYSRLRLDAEGRILDCNVEAAKLLRNVRVSLLQQPFHNFIAPEDQSQFHACLERGRFERKKFSALLHLQTGKVRLAAQLAAAPIAEPSGEVCQFEVGLQDVSRCERLNEDLAVSEQNLQELIMACPHPILLQDPEGRWVLANDTLLQLLGMMGVNYRHKFPSEFLSAAAGTYPGLSALDEANALAIQAGHTRRRNIAVPREHAPSLLLDIVSVPLKRADGSLRGLLCLGYDLTERHQTEDAVHISEKQLSAVFMQTIDAVFMLDDELRITAANPAACTLLALAEEDVLQKRLPTLLHIRAPNTAKSLWPRLLQRKPYHGEWHVDLPPKRVLLVEYRIRPNVLPNLHLLVLHDITENRRLEEEILKTSEREQRRIGRDLHDGLGQQLTAIELLCQTLREAIPDTAPDQQKLAAHIVQLLRDAVKDTRALVQGLTPFHHGQEGLQSGLRHLVMATGSLGILKCRFHSPVPVHIQDEDMANHLYRIAQEAIHNALKHSKAQNLNVHLTRTPGTLHLKITDDGQGLPLRQGEAPGMGLRVMKYRATLIGAELLISSAAGEGVSICCNLPEPT